MSIFNIAFSYVSRPVDLGVTLNLLVTKISFPQLSFPTWSVIYICMFSLMTILEGHSQSKIKLYLEGNTRLVGIS